MTEFFQLVVVGLSTGSTFALVGMSLVLVYRTTGIVNFAQGVFAVAGGLFTFQLSDDLPLVLAMFVSVLLAAFLSSILAVVAVGFRDRTTSLASTIITLGAAFLAQALLLLKFGDIPRSYRGISDRAWNIEGVLVQPQYVLIAAVAVLCAVALTAFLRRTIVGQSLVACSDSRRAAELVGLNIRSLAVVAFAGAGALCALGGALLAPSNPMTYSSDVAITVNGFAAAVFGGLGSIRLALLGGYALGILEQFVVGYVDPQYSLTIALIVMLVLGWRSRAEIASASHDAHAAIQRARVPWPARVRIGLILAGAVFACWLPYQLSTFDVALYDRMGLYALVTIGLTLLMGYAGQISLGQGAFFLIGAYTSAILTVGIDPDTRLVDPDAGVSPLLAVLAAPVVAAVLAALIGVPLLRLHGHYLAFATLALHLIAFSVLSAWDRFTGGQYGISVTTPLTVFGHDLRGPLHAAVVWGVVAGASSSRPTSSTRGSAARCRRSPPTRRRRPRRASPSRATSCGCSSSRRLSRGSAEACSPSRSSSSRPRRSRSCSASSSSSWSPSAVSATSTGRSRGLSRSSTSSRRATWERSDLFGWDLPDAAPTVFSFGVFGLILMTIMLFFPRGLLPALSDATAATVRGVRRRGALPSAPAAGRPSA